VQAVPAEHDRPELGAVHEHEPDPRVVHQGRQQLGEVALDGLQVHPALVLGERHHRHVPGRHHDDARRNPGDETRLAALGAVLLRRRPGALHAGA
jgi:hypothetical protein